MKRAATPRQSVKAICRGKGSTGGLLDGEVEDEVAERLWVAVGVPVVVGTSLPLGLSLEQPASRKAAITRTATAFMSEVRADVQPALVGDKRHIQLAVLGVEVGWALIVDVYVLGAKADRIVGRAGVAVLNHDLEGRLVVAEAGDVVPNVGLGGRGERDEGKGGHEGEDADRHGLHLRPTGGKGRTSRPLIRRLVHPRA